MPQVSLIFLAAASFLLPAALVTAYSLNVFYSRGAFFWDSGLFSYFASFSDQWPIRWPGFLHRSPDALPGSFFEIHFTPIFFLLTFVKQHLLPWATPATWLSVVQGIWAGLIAFSVFVLGASRSRSLFFSFAVALASAMSGPMLAALAFTHIEVAISSLLLLFFALQSIQYKKCSYVALLLCLLVREDAGLHAAGWLGTLAFARLLSGEGWQKVKRSIPLVLACFAFSIVSLGIQRFGFPSEISQLERIYLGTPAGAHITLELMAARVPQFLTDYGYATWPMLMLLAAAVWKRSYVLAVGAVVPLPWVLISLIAVRLMGLSDYYSFPMLITISWPSIACHYVGSTLPVLRLGIPVASIALYFFLGFSPNIDKRPWLLLSWPPSEAIGHYEEVLRDAVSQYDGRERLMLDGAAVSLIPREARLDQWTWQWALDNLPNPDALIYLPGARDSEDTRRILAASGLRTECRLGNTPFVIAAVTRSPLCK